MSLAFEAVRASVERDWRRFLSLLTPLTEDDGWTAPTRLRGWSVRDLAVHSVWGVSMEADALHRWRTSAGGRADGRRVDASANGEGVVNELDAAVRALVSELEAAAAEGGPEAPAPLPYGDVPVPMFLDILVMEAGVHASDLADALGFDDGLPDDVVAASAAFLNTFLPLLASRATEPPPGPTTLALQGTTVRLAFHYDGEAWRPADDAATGPAAATVAGDDSTVLLYALGRVPVDDPGLTVTGDPAAASLFKSWVPGP